MILRARSQIRPGKLNGRKVIRNNIKQSCAVIQKAVRAIGIAFVIWLSLVQISSHFQLICNTANGRLCELIAKRCNIKIHSAYEDLLIVRNIYIVLLHVKVVLVPP